VLRARYPNWQFLSDDFELFEALSQQLATFGPWSEHLALGNNTMGYHVLVYYWFGLIAQFSHAEPFVIIERIVPPTISLLLSTTVYLFLRLLDQMKSSAAVIGIGIYFTLSLHSMISPSHMLGVAALLIALFTTAKLQCRQDLGFSATLFLCYLTTGTMFIKFSEVPFLAGALVLVGFSSGRFCRASWRGYVIRLLPALAGSVSVLIVNVAFGANERLIADWFRPFGYVRERSGDLMSLSPVSLRVIVSSMLTFSLVALALIAYREVRECLAVLFETSGSPIAVAAMGMAMAVAIVSGHGEFGYFVGSPLAFSNLVAAVAVVLIGAVPLRLRQLAIISGFVLGIVLMELNIRIIDGGTMSVTLRAFTAMPLALVGTISVAIVQLFRKRERRLLVIVIALMTHVGFNASQWIRSYADARSQSPTLSYSVWRGDPSRIEVAEWIRSNVSIDSVFASNAYCADCAGGLWLRSDLRAIERKEEPKYQFGGENVMLSAYSGRQFIADGPAYLWRLNGHTAVTKKIAASLAFANDPSPTSRHGLDEFSVTHFVVDTTLTDNDSWAPWAVEVYRNGRFVVLRLD
jgi:hypothetical protein